MTTKTVPKEQLRGWVCSLFEFGSDKWFDYESEFMALAKLIEDRAAPPAEPNAAQLDNVYVANIPKLPLNSHYVVTSKTHIVCNCPKCAVSAPDVGMPDEPHVYEFTVDFGEGDGLVPFVRHDVYIDLRAHAEALQRRLELATHDMLLERDRAERAEAELDALREALEHLRDSESAEPFVREIAREALEAK